MSIDITLDPSIRMASSGTLNFKSTPSSQIVIFCVPNMVIIYRDKAAKGLSRLPEHFWRKSGGMKKNMASNLVEASLCIAGHVRRVRMRQGQLINCPAKPFSQIDDTTAKSCRYSLTDLIHRRGIDLDFSRLPSVHII